MEVVRRGFRVFERDAIYEIEGHQFVLLYDLARIIPVLKKYWGDSHDVIPRSKEHAKDAEIVNRSSAGFPGSGPGTIRFSRF